MKWRAIWTILAAVEKGNDMFANPLRKVPAAAIVLVFTLGCAKKDGTTQPGGDSPRANAASGADLATAKADFTLAAADWLKEWKNDSKAAQAKYKGKTVELQGEVRSTSEDPYGNVGYVFLTVEGETLGVRCATSDKEPWLMVGPGCKVKMKGKAAESGLSGDLYPCVIAESTPNTTQTITAQQLTKEFTADKKATKEKYDGKLLIVEGELVNKGKSEFCALLVELKGEGNTKVLCCCGAMSEDQRKRNDALKIGQKIKVCGQASIFATDNDVGLNSCMLPVK
jgi:hypothetical protein